VRRSPAQFQVFVLSVCRAQLAQLPQPLRNFETQAIKEDRFGLGELDVGLPELFVGPLVVGVVAFD
jgi:hypothetical protein